jgi:hypothetical protein
MDEELSAYEAELIFHVVFDVLEANSADYLSADMKNELHVICSLCIDTACNPETHALFNYLSMSITRYRLHQRPMQEKRAEAMRIARAKLGPPMAEAMQTAFHSFPVSHAYISKDDDDEFVR